MDVRPFTVQRLCFLLHCMPLLRGCTPRHERPGRLREGFLHTQPVFIRFLVSFISNPVTSALQFHTAVKNFLSVVVVTQAGSHTFV